MDIQALKSTFQGELFEPASAGYHDTRKIWNASIDKRPRLIAPLLRCRRCGCRGELRTREQSPHGDPRRRP